MRGAIDYHPNGAMSPLAWKHRLGDPGRVSVVDVLMASIVLYTSWALLVMSEVGAVQFLL